MANIIASITMTRLCALWKILDLLFAAGNERFIFKLHSITFEPIWSDFLSFPTWILVSVVSILSGVSIFVREDIFSKLSSPSLTRRFTGYLAPGAILKNHSKYGENQ